MAENHEILTGYPIEEFLASQKDRSWNKETIACYSRLLRETQQYFDQNGPLNEETLKAWQEELHAKNIKSEALTQGSLY